ncbi:MAG: hypothetical protein LBT21_02545 [Oscillospiraceae bacterium]|jgi:hypothetical protein|nr:hypothetical protein [Oscillospiraceae bacterium]
MDLTTIINLFQGLFETLSTEFGLGVKVDEETAGTFQQLFEVVRQLIAKILDGSL